jgi:MFS transporter, putative metabolite:H+ symporter
MAHPVNAGARLDRLPIGPVHDRIFWLVGAGMFPTEARLRANGICNTLGRPAAIVSPFIVLGLAINYKMPGVLGLMIGLVVIQILVVWAWGVESRQRGLEDVALAKAA